MANDVTSLEHLKQIREACLSNAEDLLNSAKTVIDGGALQVSYHLAVLALEEIGKLGLMEVKYNFGRLAEDREYNPDIEDHTKKLFWAFFAMHLAGHKLDRSEFDSMRGLASQIHKNRLESLYVDVVNPVAPRSKLKQENVEQLIRLTEARIGFERAQKFTEPSPGLDEAGKWFVLAAEDREKRSFIFSETSYAKLAELQSFRKWIEWIKTSYEESQKELQDLLEQEIARQTTADGSDLKVVKWKAFVTFVSDSHTIRTSFISEWTKTSTHFLVGKTSRNNELACQFLLPKQVTIADVYDKGFAMAKIMAVALNIGTLGFFWWYVPSMGYYYSDRILDLENDTRLNFHPPEGLKVERKREALKAEHVLTIKLVLAYIVRIKGKAEEVALDAYLTGLSLFAKCDCHIDFITNAFESFFRALKSAMAINGDINKDETFYDAVSRYLGDAITDSEELKRHLEIGQVIANTKQSVESVRLNDVADMKSYCDAYFLFRAAVVVRDSVMNP